MTSQPRQPPADDIVARLETDEQSARKVADTFAEGFAAAEIAVSLTEAGQGRWRVALYFRGAPDEDAVRRAAAAAAGPAAAQAIRFERVAAKDWVAESLAGLKPVQAGRFIVHGAHDRARIPPNRIGIEIEAALAFGTGHHATTRGCLLALDWICKALSKRRTAVHRYPQVRAHKRVYGRLRRAMGAPRRMSVRGVRAVALRGSSLRDEHLRVTGQRLRILDLGTGSGVLAIAAARALRQRVLATDVDEQAVRVARGNARLNRVGPLIEAVRADGVARRAVRSRAPFDLVLANILLGPLQRFAAPLINLTAPGARIVLSGLLASQANAALFAYRPLALERRIDLDGWTTLVLARRSS